MPQTIFVLVTRKYNHVERNRVVVEHFTFSTAELAQEAADQMDIDDYFIYDTILDEEPQP